MLQFNIDVVIAWSTGVKPVPKNHATATPEIQFREMCQAWLKLKQMQGKRDSKSTLLSQCKENMMQENNVVVERDD